MIAAAGNLDGLGQALLGAALLFLAMFASVPLALVHAGCAWFELGEASARRLKVLWLVTGGCITIAAVVMGGIDELLVPYLPVAVLGPFALAAAAAVTGTKLRAGQSPGDLDRWSNRLGPLAWLAVFAYVVVRVFPHT